MKPSGHYEKFSDRRRKKDMAFVAVMCSVCVALFVNMGIGASAGAYDLWIAAAFALFGGLIVFLIYRKKEVFVPDPPQLPPPILLSEDEIKANAEAAAKWERTQKMWWYRYPVAILAFGGAWLLLEWRPKAWWVSVILVLYGLVIAKELGLVVFWLSLAGLAIYLIPLVLNGIASLPVSLAIIIGAIIIAGAVSK